MSILSDVFNDLMIRVENILNDLDSLEKLSHGVYKNQEAMISFDWYVLRVLNDYGIIMMGSNIIQRQYSNGDCYRSDVIRIPESEDVTFFDIKTEEEFFQLSTLVDLSYLTFNDLVLLNTVREYLLELD